MLRRIASTSSSWAPLPLRLALGVIFIAHGAQLVFGSFGGPGLKQVVSFPPPFAFMRPGWLWMGAAAIAELVGGILVLLGFLTRFGAFLIACVMATAMIGVHWKNGFFLTPESQGIEFTAVLLGGAFALLISGGGRVSIDRAISRRR